MGRQESPQLIERKTQVDTDAQETSRASKYKKQLIGKGLFSIFWRISPINFNVF